MSTQVTNSPLFGFSVVLEFSATTCKQVLFKRNAKPLVKHGTIWNSLKCFRIWNLTENQSISSVLVGYSLIPFWLSQLKTWFGKVLINFRILFWKTKLFQFRRVGLKLFPSMIVEGKKEFLKKLCLILKRNVINVSCCIYLSFFRW